MLEILRKSFAKVDITYSQKDKFTPKGAPYQLIKLGELIYEPKHHLIWL